jgi:hypothetical protein
LISEREEEEARDLFNMPGWKNLVDEWEEQIQMCNLDSCNTIEDLHFQKGRLAVLRMMLNFENYIKNITEDDDEDPTFQ